METMSTLIYVLGNFGIYYLRHLNAVPFVALGNLEPGTGLGKIYLTPLIYITKNIIYTRKKSLLFSLSTSFRAILCLSELELP